MLPKFFLWKWSDHVNYGVYESLLRWTFDRLTVKIKGIELADSLAPPRTLTDVNISHKNS